MAIPTKLPKDFKLFQIRVFDICPGCDGSGKKPYHPLEACPICGGTRIVYTILYEGATLDILLAKVIQGASKQHVNELIIEES